DLVASHDHGTGVRARPLDLRGHGVVADHPADAGRLHVGERGHPTVEVLPGGLPVPHGLGNRPVEPDEVISEHAHEGIGIMAVPRRQSLPVQPFDLLPGHRALPYLAEICPGFWSLLLFLAWRFSFRLFCATFLLAL